MVHSVRYSACISFITCNIFETTSREMSSQNTNQPRRSLRLSGYQTHVCVLNSCDYLLMQKHLFSIQQFLEEYLAFLVQVCKWSFRLVAPKSQMYNTSSLSFFFYVCHHLCVKAIPWRLQISMHLSYPLILVYSYQRFGRFSMMNLLEFEENVTRRLQTMTLRRRINILASSQLR